MKFLIATTLLFVCNLFVVFVLNPVSLSVLIVGVVFAGVFMGYSFFVRKERDLFKEENQLFIDTFQKIRNPIALVKTPLEVACHQCESDRLRNELLIVIRSLACLDQHMSDLLSLKYLFLRSGDTGIAEHELGTFIRHRIHLLKPLAERRGIELQCTAGFDFLSVWINTKVVAPVIDRFVKYTILGATSGERIVFSITGNNDYWSIKTQHAEEADTLVLYQKYLSLLLQTKLIGTFQRGALIKKTLKFVQW